MKPHLGLRTKLIVLKYPTQPEIKEGHFKSWKNTSSSEDKQISKAKFSEFSSGLKLQRVEDMLK